MSAALEQAIRELQQRRDQIDDAITAIKTIMKKVEYSGRSTNGRENTMRELEQNGFLKRGDTEILKVDTTRESVAYSDEMVEKIRRFPDPFTPVEAAVVLVTANHNAWNYIAKWKERQWVEKVSFGKYKLTEKFKMLYKPEGL